MWLSPNTYLAANHIYFPDAWVEIMGWNGQTKSNHCTVHNHNKSTIQMFSIAVLMYTCNECIKQDWISWLCR
jgi:hypothetical protein